MLRLARTILTLGIAACATAPAMRSASQPAGPTEASVPALQPTPADSLVEYLLTSAATDFHDHTSPSPVRVRDVRVGHFTNREGEVHYMLCGQFLPAQGGMADWTPFATIKTVRYEQWLGPQAAGFCQSPSVAWDTVGDLSASLQSRLDSLR